MSRRKVLTAAGSLALAALLATPWPHRAAFAESSQDAAGPAAVARQFLRAFEKKDWAAVRTLFAPEAVVSTVMLAREGGPTVAYLTAEQWLAQTEKEMAPVTFVALDLIDTSVLSFDQGATVSVRFRSTGKIGERSFTNNGIDTYSLTQSGGTWRILRYGTFELLELR